MRRGQFVAPWVICALLAPAVRAGIARAAPADHRPVATAADGGDRVAECVQLSQTAHRASVDISLHSGCDAAVSCTLRWSLVCGHSAKRRARAKRFALAPGEDRTVTASAAACGDAGWTVRDVRWYCHSAGPASN